MTGPRGRENPLRLRLLGKMLLSTDSWQSIITPVTSSLTRWDWGTSTPPASAEGLS
jgi:hypothetical protein